MALMFPEFFGGEGGITTNRVYGKPLGHHLRPAIQVYYLIAVYCFVCTAAMFAFTGTPLGRMLNAVRDNPERVEFVGYNTQRVRYWPSSSQASLPASAGLAAINFEIVTAADSVSVVRSGGYLLFTFLGGATFFFGPIIGAVLMVLAIGAAVRADQGLAAVPGPGLPVHGDVCAGRRGQPDHDESARGQVRQAGAPVAAYLALGGTALAALLGAAAMIEMIYHLQLNAALGHAAFMGMTLECAAPGAGWCGRCC
jgi:branched-chain amino acid transport system permease protein